ncbi:TPA: hypothetical protein ACTYMW_001099 [Enterobacter hormaechei]
MKLNYEELEAKCSALAAELRAVEAIHNEAVFITDDRYEQCPAEVQRIIRSLAVMQIPAYQAFRLMRHTFWGVFLGMIWGIKFLNRLHRVTILRIAPETVVHQQRMTQQPAHPLAVFFQPSPSRANVASYVLANHR